MGFINKYFSYCSILVIFFTLGEIENQSDISSYSSSNEIASISTSTEIHCDTDIRLHKITYNWNINHFDLHRAVEGSENNSLISPTFSSSSNDKIKWYLEILAGNETSEEISLHICFSNQSKETKARAKFTVDFLDNERNLIIRLGDDSFYAFNNHHELWGWDNIQVDEVLLPDNTLKIVCNITFCEYTNNIFYRNRNDIMLHPECNLCQDFGHLLNNPQLSDLVLVLSKSGKEYPVHKAILAARSPAFADMFKRHKEKGKKTRRVNITDVREQVFDEILRYIYTDECENIDKLSHDLLIAAHKFGLNRLKTICIEQISKNLTPGNALDTLLLADKRGFDELKSKVVRFIADNYAQVPNTSDWKHLVETNSEFVHDERRSTYLSKRTEEE